MSSRKASRPGFSRQPSDQSHNGSGDEDAPARPFSLPLGYYDYYGIPRPKVAVQAKRSLYPIPTLPRGYLEYYGIVSPEQSGESSGKSVNPVQQAQQGREESSTATQGQMPGDPSAAPTSTASTVEVNSNGSAPNNGTEHIHDAAAVGTSGPSGALPYLDEIQKSFGSHDVGHAKAHTDSQAAAGTRAMGAEAFTTGDHVVFSSAPSLHTTAHEAAHVIQQRAGVQLKGGVGEADDAYERHADEVADRVVQGQSVVALLDLVAARGQPAGQGHAAVQRQTPGGTSSGAKTDSPKGAWRTAGNLRGNPPVRSEVHPPNIDVIEDETIYMERLEAALGFQINQTARANSLLDENGNVTDHRYWFARVYSLVTNREITEARNATFYYPSYVLQCVRYFEQIYADNFAAHDAKGTVEDHWREAFRVCAKNKGLTWSDIALTLGGTGTGAGIGAAGGSAVPGVGTTVGAVGGGIVGLIGSVAAARVYAAAQSLVVSMQAHIRFDLPRAEAWVFQHYYQGQGSATIKDFHPDFNSMTDVFEQATDHMNADIAKRTGVPVKQMPRILQDLALDYWFEANMATERADTWQRTEALVNNRLAGKDPYTAQTDGKLGGNVTASNHQSGLQAIPDADLRPSMEDPAKRMSDSKIREDVGQHGTASISRRRASERVSMLRRLMSGWTGGEDQATILTILEASKMAGDVVTVIDGANAWELLHETGGNQHEALKALLRRDYYPATSTSMAFGLLRRCIDGWTKGWEEEMIVDLLVSRKVSDGRRLLIEIGAYYENGGFAQGLNKVLGELEGAERKHLQEIYGR